MEPDTGEGPGHKSLNPNNTLVVHTNRTGLCLGHSWTPRMKLASVIGINSRAKTSNSIAAYF